MWYLLCDNPRAITELFKGEPPDNPVEVHGVHLHRDGPLVQLQVEIPTFPETPHPRWPAGANTLQVHLDLWGVEGFEHVGWGTDNVGVLEIVQGETLRFSFVSESSRFSGGCEMARISKVTAYIDERKEAV